MDLMLEHVDPKDYEKLVSELTGPFRVLGDKTLSEEDQNAPAWWHGDEDAYESMSAIASMPARGTKLRKR